MSSGFAEGRGHRNIQFGPTFWSIFCLFFRAIWSTWCRSMRSGTRNGDGHWGPISRSTSDFERCHNRRGRGTVEVVECCTWNSGGARRGSAECTMDSSTRHSLLRGVAGVGRLGLNVLLLEEAQMRHWKVGGGSGPWGSGSAVGSGSRGLRRQRLSACLQPLLLPDIYEKMLHDSLLSGH